MELTEKKKKTLYKQLKNFFGERHEFVDVDCISCVMYYFADTGNHEPVIMKLKELKDIQKEICG